MACKLLLLRHGYIHPEIFRTIEGWHHVEEQILHLVYQRTCIVGIVNCTIANRKPGWRFHRFSFLLLRPDKVLSGILHAPVLEVTHDALWVLLQHHHMRVGCVA